MKISFDLPVSTDLTMLSDHYYVFVNGWSIRPIDRQVLFCTDFTEEDNNWQLKVLARGIDQVAGNTHRVRQQWQCAA